MACYMNFLLKFIHRVEVEKLFWTRQEYPSKSLLFILFFHFACSNRKDIKIN